MNTPLLPPATPWPPQAGNVYQLPALELLRGIADKSVHLILTDPPYNVVNIAWDKKINLPALWEQFKRVIRPDGAIVITAVQPFAARLIMSNLDMYRYEWVIEKTNATGFPNALFRPMRAHELAEVFSFASATGGSNGGIIKMRYYPQYLPGVAYSMQRRGKYEGYNVKQRTDKSYGAQRFPRSVIKVNNVADRGLHPTQKPLELMEYFINTYTQAGDMVVDPFCGSGTTGVAAFELGRDFIMSDISPHYCQIARRRLQHTTPDMFAASERSA